MPMRITNKDMKLMASVAKARYWLLSCGTVALSIEGDLQDMALALVEGRKWTKEEWAQLTEFGGRQPFQPRTNYTDPANDWLIKDDTDWSSLEYWEREDWGRKDPNGQGMYAFMKAAMAFNERNVLRICREMGQWLEAVNIKYGMEFRVDDEEK